MKFILAIVILCGCCACNPPHQTHSDLTPVVPQAHVSTPVITAEPATPATVLDSKADEESPILPPKAVKDRDKEIAEISGRLEDAYFAYDRSEISAEALDALRKDAAVLVQILAEFPETVVIVEGHCDERGSAEYNIALGDHRAARAAAILRESGLPSGRMRTISYGKEAPQCTEPAETCWRRNRRAHLSVR